MRVLYLDCAMGAAGDMLTAALIELLPNPDEFIDELNALGINGVQVVRERSVKCGITGTHISVKINGMEEGAESLSKPVHGGERQGAGYEKHPQADHGHTHDGEYPHTDHGHMHDDGECSHVDHGYTHDGECSHVDHGYTYDGEYCHADHGHTHDEKHPHADHGHAHDKEWHNAGCEHTHKDEHFHHHSDMHEIEQIIFDMNLSKQVQDNILAVYRLITQAEGHVHGVPSAEIHFHEVGTKDAIMDITAVCMLMDRLSVDEVIVSPVHVGCGQVRCAHGILPVPAPATAHILKDVPIYGGRIEGELCTPTGAALLKHFAARFGDMPVMKTEAIGYGMGKKDFPAANCVRAMLGTMEDKSDVVLELSCNVDDMTAEAVSFAMERLFEGGALEVYTVPIGMKKSRPGTLIRVMCRQQNRENIVRLLFTHTTTIGIRETVTHRYVLERGVETLHTPYGDVRCKHSCGYGVSRFKYEYEDLARIAKGNNISIEAAQKQVASYHIHKT